MTNFITKVRVKRSQMPGFPFDVFYLVPYEHRQLLPKIFPWSICVIVGDGMVNCLHRLSIDTIEGLGASPPLLKDEKYTGTFQGFTKLKEYFLLVPVLPQRKMSYHQLRYRQKYSGVNVDENAEQQNQADYQKFVTHYITAPRHARSKYSRAKFGRLNTDDNKFKGLFDERTVLFTPQGPCRPPCIRCSRHLLHLQGKCSFGSSICWDTLVLKGPHEQLCQDNADADSNSEGNQPFDSFHNR